MPTKRQPKSEEPNTLSGVYDDLLQGLEEALAWARGEGEACVTVITQEDSPEGDGTPVYTRTVKMMTVREYKEASPMTGERREET